MSDKDKAEEGIHVHQFTLKLSADNGEVFGQVVKFGDKCDQVTLKIVMNLTSHIVLTLTTYHKFFYPLN